MPLIHHLSMHVNQPFPGLLISGPRMYKHGFDQLFQFVNMHLQRPSLFPRHCLGFCPFPPGIGGPSRGG